jgi:hypothetical protein
VLYITYCYYWYDFGVITIGILLYEKTFMKVFTVHFHKISFSERVSIVNHQNEILEKIHKAARLHRERPGDSLSTGFFATAKEKTSIISRGLHEVTLAWSGVDLWLWSVQTCKTLIRGILLTSNE